jgi:hypothetical protein
MIFSLLKFNEKTCWFVTLETMQQETIDVVALELGAVTVKLTT